MNIPVLAPLALVILVEVASAQVVLQWGGPAPPAMPDSQLQVLSFRWSDVHPAAGGSTYQLDMGDGVLRALQIDPSANLAAPAQRQGGVYDDHDVVFDGDLTSSWVDVGFKCANLRTGCDDIYAGRGTNEIDLGRRLPLERIVVLSGLADPGLTVSDFRVHLSPDLPTDFWCCAPFRPVVAEVRDNREQIREVRLPALQRARFVQVAIGERENGWEIHDIEIYGRGFVEYASYISNIVAFDRPMAWGQLRWSGRQAGQAAVQIQTRTGTDATPDRYWRFTGRGGEKEEVDQERYETLGVGEKAGTSHDRAHWSFWSAPYDFADSTGAAVVSPGPRSYFQFRVDIVPQDEDGGEIGHLELRAWVPVVSRVVGEVWPVEATVGEWRQYTYALRPTIGPQDTGFDRLEIRSEAFLGQVLDVRVGDEPVSWRLETVEPHRFVVAMPALQARDTGVLLEVDFEAQVLRYGAHFDGSVWDGSQTPAPQAVDPGDASGEYEGNRVSVATAVRSPTMLSMAVEPCVLTPNGDGVNDTATLAYEIYEITVAATMEVGVYDLAGRRVRHLHRGAETVGRYRRVWDGRDDTGRLLPPGTYVARVALTADQQSEVGTDLVHVAH